MTSTARTTSPSRRSTLVTLVAALALATAIIAGAWQLGAMQRPDATDAALARDAAYDSAYADARAESFDPAYADAWQPAFERGATAGRTEGAAAGVAAARASTT